MIFVTVGTHEQPFDRLIRCVDELKKNGRITEDVFIQTGFSDYEPSACSWEKLISADRMNEMIRKAHIVITHGGPASFLAPILIGKVPVVVPRQKQFAEHVNDHQLNFCRAVSQTDDYIILVEDISELEKVIEDYDSLAAQKDIRLAGNNEAFVKGFEQIIDELFRQ